jgi:hypothetical protein
MTAPLPPLRERTTSARPSAVSPAAAQEARIAAQHAAFDVQVAETAELLREHQALEALMQEQLKNEDEIMKKWIAMI